MKWNKPDGLLKIVFTVTGIAIALLAPVHSVAQNQITYSPLEMALLPEYCKYTQLYRDRVLGGRDPVKINQWYAIFGGSPGEGLFHAMHHYCWGLTHINYANLQRGSQQERRHNLERSIGEFDYVIRHSKPSDKIMPEIHTKKGESLMALSRAPLAIMEFEHAITLNPDYWPPYAAMSDYYKETGNVKLAREVLDRGLSSSPGALALTRRLAELNAIKGKPNPTSQLPR